VRAIWATSCTAVAASAVVGVLLGAYLHELEINDRNVFRPADATTTVQTRVSTVIVTVPGGVAPVGSSAGSRARPPGDSPPRPVADVTSATQPVPLTTPPPAPASTTAGTTTCGSTYVLPPGDCAHGPTSRNRGGGPH
jgi:hypothetical protein